MDYLCETLAHDKLILVNFFKEGSKESKKVDKILNAIRKELGFKIMIIKVDAISHKFLADKYKVQHTSTLALYRYSKQLWKHSGALIKKDKLLSAINSIL